VKDSIALKNTDAGTNKLSKIDRIAKGSYTDRVAS